MFTLQYVFLIILARKSVIKISTIYFYPFLFMVYIIKYIL